MCMQARVRVRVSARVRARVRSLGTLVQAEREGFLCLSAGHTAHPATTAAATEHAFAFLRRAAAGAAAQANSELRG